MNPEIPVLHFLGSVRIEQLYWGQEEEQQQEEAKRVKKKNTTPNQHNRDLATFISEITL